MKLMSSRSVFLWFLMCASLAIQLSGTGSHWPFANWLAGILLGIAVGMLFQKVTAERREPSQL